MEAAANNSLEMRQDEEREVDWVAVPLKSPTPRDKDECYRCGGTNHSLQNCRYKEAVCRKYKRRGHIAQKCRGKDGARSTAARWVDAEEEVATVYKIGPELHPMKVHVQVQIEGRPLTMEVNTGAAVSLSPETVLTK